MTASGIFLIYKKTHSDNIKKFESQRKYLSIHDAICARDTIAVKYFIANGGSIQQNEGENFGPLHEAVSIGDLEITKILLEKGSTVHAKAWESGWTPLHEAAANGSIEIAELLINYGTDINEKSCANQELFYNNPETPLMIAARAGHQEMVRYLIKKGAQVTEPDNSGRSAINCAGQGGHIKIIEYLLSCGAKINDINLLDVMAHGDNAQDIINLCISHGADINKEYETGYRAYTKTLLIQALEENNIELVSYLIKNGAKVNMEDCDGRTALHYAVNADHPDKKQIVQLLLDNGADINIKDGITNETALDMAYQSNDSEIVQLLKSYASKETIKT